MADLNRILRGENGEDAGSQIVDGDHFQNPAEQARLRARIPAPAPAPAASKPNVWQRVAAIFQGKKIDARTTYLKMLFRAEVNGEDLSDAEAQVLVESMNAAGISLEQSERQRAAIGRWRQAKKASSELEKRRASSTDLKAQLDQIQKQIQVLVAKAAPINQKLAEISAEESMLTHTSATLQGEREFLESLFGKDFER